MASTTTTTKRARRKPSKPRRLSNAQLLKLAARKRPPQAWYDDQTDPTQPAQRASRGR